MISAQVICDSISPQEKRLPTLKLRYPKFIHGEAKTHRVLRLGNEGGYVVLEQEVGFMDDPNLSRNASSSRAVPVHRMIEEVRNESTMACPVYFGREQKGMQSGEAFVGAELKFVMRLWRDAALSAADHAERMWKAGLHKSLVNRIIEPYTHINVVVSATEWDNFFGLRLHKDAQPEMRTLAIAMWEALKASTPKMLSPGAWHLPFVEVGSDGYIDDLIKISVARCARVSYEDFETGKPSTFEKDLQLYDRLLKGLTPPTRLLLQDPPPSEPLHASPAEHQGTPDTHQGRAVDYQWMNPWQHGNFVGWRQYRKMLPGEARAPIPKEFL